MWFMTPPPHLIESVRNNLKKHGFSVNGKPPLPPFAPLRVKLATQVLSHSVAAGISTTCTLGALPNDAMETAQFVERMDMVFNCFNSVFCQFQCTDEAFIFSEFWAH